MHKILHGFPSIDTKEVLNMVEKLEKIISQSQNIVFFGGAGVSTESGVPDFRSVDGLYNQKFEYPPETIISHSFFVRNPEEFYRFYRKKLLCPEAKPNAAHRKLAELEATGKLNAVVTQNIDGLHQMAGSKRVYELHGSVYRNRCTRCGKKYPPEFIRDSVLPKMAALRAPCDAAEKLIPAKSWPFPTYAELMFGVK